jgi:hypothetical protein
VRWAPVQDRGHPLLCKHKALINPIERTLPHGGPRPIGAGHRAIERGTEQYIRGGDVFRLLPDSVGKKM